jgi:hypothetical protein
MSLAGMMIQWTKDEGEARQRMSTTPFPSHDHTLPQTREMLIHWISHETGSKTASHGPKWHSIKAYTAVGMSLSSKLQAPSGGSATATNKSASTPARTASVV